MILAMFEGRNLLIATKHQKEKIISPVFEKALGVKCIVPPNLDTDLLGTFTGEIERVDHPIETAKKKCRMALELENSDLVVASEGSFGAHPSLFFVQANEETLIFIDRRNDLEIVVNELSLETNFRGTGVHSVTELKSFAMQCNFPSHGLILRKSKNDFSDIVKGIISYETLYRYFDYFISSYGSAFVETDMRAMYNPTRMKVIEKAAIKLVTRINSVCPKCETPGFGVTDTKRGLPCANCYYPTQSILSYIHKCIKCAYSKEEKFPNGKFNEDPMYCDICNP